jgi:hypothetical protein
MAVQVLAGHWSFDLESRELLLCPRSREMFGIEGNSPKMLGKRDWLPRIHPEDMPIIEGEFEAAGRLNETYAARFRAVRPDGSICEILGVGRPTVRHGARFVGLNFDLVATAASADFESRRPGGTLVEFAGSLAVRPRPANENATSGRPARSSPGAKSPGPNKRAREEAARQMLLERALATTEMRQLRAKLLDPTMSGEPSLDMLFSSYVTHATSGILKESRKAHAARFDAIHEELGQRLTAIALAAGAIEVGGETADALTLIRVAVEEARHELKSHRNEAWQEVLP